MVISPLFFVYYLSFIGGIMPELQVGLGERSYPIIIKSGCFSDVASYLLANRIGNKYGLVYDSKVADLYGDRLFSSLRASGVDVKRFVFPQGEVSKTLQTIGNLASLLAQNGFDRRDGLIALGGGVTGDLVGFLASSYMRGIPFLQIPTTLLAQVDSSVGGKTGVDIPEGKNLLGAFYQPQNVFIDTALLSTLPKKELLGGMAEVIKYSIIRDGDFFDFLVTKREQILALEDKTIEEMVYTCCKIKADVVAEDEREGNIRRILNFGHTIGHALEAASDYSLIHGFAVSIGMVTASRLAVYAGYLDNDICRKITGILKEYNLPREIPANIDRRAIKKYLLTDKKIVDGRVNYVLPTAIGATIITDSIAPELVDKVLH